MPPQNFYSKDLVSSSLWFGGILQFLFIHKLVRTKIGVDRNTPIIRVASYELTYKFLGYILIATIALWLVASVPLGISYEKLSTQKGVLLDDPIAALQLDDNETFGITEDASQSREYEVKRGLVQKYLLKDDGLEANEAVPTGVEQLAGNSEIGDATKQDTRATSPVAVGHKRALEMLHAALSKNHPMPVRAAAALAELGETNSSIVNTLVTALEDEDSDLRRLAAEGLGRIGDDRSIEALISILDDADVTVQNSAVFCITKPR